MFRNPLYLDLQLLQNIAEYFGIELASDAQVTRRTVDDHRGKVGIQKGIELGREKGSSEEVTEVYSTSIRPVRAMNDVVDELLKNAHIIDLTNDRDALFSQRDIVQIEGVFSLSPVTEIGAVMAALTPIMLEQMASGGGSAELDPSKIGEVLMGGGNGEKLIHVFEVDLGDGRPLAVTLATPHHLFGTATMDDLDGELTLLGSVDRVIAEGQEFSLERHLLPGLNRTIRRALGSNGMGDLVESFSEMLGRPLGPSDISVAGPAVLVSTIAIY